MILGETIALRALEQRDIETLRGWRNHPDIFPYHFSSMPLSEIEQQRWFELYTSSGNQIVFIIDNLDRNAVGYTLIKHLDHKNQNAEIGLYLDPGAQGKGYGKDAFLTLMKYCFKQLNLHRLYLEVFDFNERAIKMYEKLGFTTEGKKRQAYYSDGEFHDIVQMSILRGEFQS